MNLDAAIAHQQCGLSLKWRATAMLYYVNLGWTLGFPRGYNLFSKCSTNNRTCFGRQTIQLESTVTQKVNPWHLFAQNFPKRPIGHFRFHYHSDGLNQRWRTCPDFWHSRPIIVLTFWLTIDSPLKGCSARLVSLSSIIEGDTLNARFHKVSTINGHGSEQTSRAN